MPQKYVSFDAATGKITGFYDDSIHAASQIPAACLPIGDAQWRTCLEQPGQWTVQNGVLAQAPPPSAAQRLATAQAGQISVLSQSCRTAILSGFTSSALGYTSTYPSNTDDQRNLSDAMSASLAPNPPAAWTTPLWCEANGGWKLMAHTAAQVQQVHCDWIAFRIAQQNKLIALTGQVNAAETPAAAAAIGW